MWLGHHPHQITCSHHWEVQPWEIQPVEGIPKRLTLDLAIFFLDGDILESKLGKIASGLYALLENNLENLKHES